MYKYQRTLAIRTSDLGTIKARVEFETLHGARWAVRKVERLNRLNLTAGRALQNLCHVAKVFWKVPGKQTEWDKRYFITVGDAADALAYCVWQALDSAKH